MQDSAELVVYGNYGFNKNDIVTNSSIIQFSNGFVALLGGGDILNSGLIEFANNSAMYFHASLTLQGGGVWQLSDSFLDDTDDDVLENQNNLKLGDGDVFASTFKNDAGLCWRVGLIVAELIANSMRHGLRFGEGEIEVELIAGSAGFSCHVSDSGRGAASAPARRGRRLVGALMDEVGGSAEWLFGEGGTCVRLEFAQVFTSSSTARS